MVKILVTPEQIDEVASQFKNASTQGREIVGNLNNRIQGLQGSWEGMTQQRFFNEFQEAKKNMDSFVQLLESINTQLGQIATRFREADQGPR